MRRSTRLRKAAGETIVPEVVGCGSLPEWVSSDSVNRLGRVVDLHNSAVRDLQSFAVSCVVCGMELLALKAEIGHGRWGEFFAAHIACHGLSERQSRRYMQVAAAAIKFLHKQGGNGMRLALKDPSNMDAEALQSLQQAISETTDATTWRELLEAFGLAKTMGAGGFHPPRHLIEQFAEERGIPADYNAWPQPVQEEFREWLKVQNRQAPDPDSIARRRQAAAMRRWTPVLANVARACLRPETIAVLDASTRLRLRDDFRRCAEVIDSTLTEARP